MNYISIVKLFIRAERTGDWNLHFKAAAKMENLFIATGHINYAKSARLYLQMMHGLPETHPWLYEQLSNGFHTIRRSDIFWASISSDLAIEQILMRTIKTRGGLRRGRGFTEAVRTLWVYTMHRCAGIHLAMSELTDLQRDSNENHIETDIKRMKRDNKDVATIASR